MNTLACPERAQGEQVRRGEGGGGRAVVTEEIVAFLGNVPPFQFLGEAALEKVVAGISLDYYPKGTQILSQDGPPSEFLSVIRQGGVKVFLRSDEGEELGVDYRNEGEAFGYLSLVSRDRSRTNVVAVADTLAYQVPRDTVLGLLESSPVFREYFEKTYLNRLIDKTFFEARARGLLPGGGERLLFTTPVGELAARHIVTAPESSTIHAAAAVMAARNISSLILVDERGAPSGIVTDRDLREKVVSAGRPFLDGVRTIMSPLTATIDARSLCSEALLRMIHGGIHHLVVVEKGRPVGVITNHDLMLLQGSSPLSLARDIESRQTIEGVVAASRRVNDIFSLLLKEGARASNITRVVTEINDRLVLKILQLGERTLGRPPLPYCWIAFGSEGRKEQTFKTDQDNAIVYDDPASPEAAVTAREYFGRFAAFVNESLVRCGFPECPGNYMARNPEWCQPLAVWKSYFSGWITTPTEEAVLHSVILFDFRPVGGALGLGESLKQHLLGALAGQGIFLKRMAVLAVSVRPPVGFFGNLAVLKSGEHKDRIDLKKKCITPLINVVRLFALQEAIPETATLERIFALRPKATVVGEYADELEQAYEFFLLLRIHHQFAQIRAAEAPDNFIDPNELSNLQKKMFRDSCRAISTVLDAADRLYNPGTRL